jgi:enediyne biosynthesis protein E4
LHFRVGQRTIAGRSHIGLGVEDAGELLVMRRGWLWPLGGLGAAGLVAGALALAWPRGEPPSPADAAAPAWFEDVTEAVGLAFTHDPGPTGNYFLPQLMGSGAALFDCDGDDRLDIYLLQNSDSEAGAKNRLFRQRPDGKFEDASAGSGLDVAGHGMGVAVGDVNNDGRTDVVVTEYRGVRLFLNAGNGRFTEVTTSAGLETVHWATSASFVDYDRDGWLDLVVVHYVDFDPSRHCPGSAARPDFCHPKQFQGTATRLYHNLGKRPDGKAVFRDVTGAAHLTERPAPGLGVLCADFDGDGWPDILVANDGKANHLWVNQKDGTFREEGLERGVAYNGLGQAEGNMGVVFGDVDGDDQPDLFITHLPDESNTLWVQGPPGQFTDKTMASGLGTPLYRGTGFGVVLADFDLDGRSDLTVVNGRIARTLRPAGTGFDWADYAERNQLFANQGGGRFRDLSAADGPFCGTPRVGRGLCGGDVFNRGRVDLLATYVGGPARLYRNVAPAAGHWLVVRAVVPEWQRDAYGAVVTVTAGAGRWTRLIQPGSSYLCSNDPRAHFGLGPADRVDAVRVTWPDGSVEVFPGGPADRHLTVRRGEGRPEK